MDTIYFEIVPTLLEAVCVSAIFFTLGAPLVALSIFLSVVAYLAFSLAITGTRTRLLRESRDASNSEGDCQVETLTNFETVQAFGRSPAEVERYSLLVAVYSLKEKVLRLVGDTLDGANQMTRVCGQFVALLLAAKLTLQPDPDRRLGAGDFVLIASLTDKLFWPFVSLSSVYKSMVENIVHLEQAVELMKLKPKIVDSEDAITLPRTEALDSQAISSANQCMEVRFENVTFQYVESKKRITRDDDEDIRDETSFRDAGISNVTFTVPPGSTTAIVGETGSGKSTIMRLILRLYDVEKGNGEVFVNGENIKKLATASLRESIGIVAQETVLFNETLLGNVRYGRPGASVEEVSQAANASALGPYIESLEKGLDTMVGERGVKLSGGQRQRVGIARAALKQAPVLLLDEATASLDTETERDVQEGLYRLCKRRTTIVIAHRLS